MNIIIICSTINKSNNTNGENTIIPIPIHVCFLSNNIANVNSTGYKKSRAEFQDLLYLSSRNNTSGANDPFVYFH